MADPLRQPLDLTAAGAEALLRGIQGNIVKGHGRNFAAHVLLAMTGPDTAARSWLSGFAAEWVTTAAAAVAQAGAYGADGGPGEPFAMVALSPDGYRRLGFTDADFPAPGSLPLVTEVTQTWPGATGSGFTMTGPVTIRGGEYFFVPSLGFLTGLAATGGAR